MSSNLICVWARLLATKPQNLSKNGCKLTKNELFKRIVKMSAIYGTHALYGTHAIYGTRLGTPQMSAIYGMHAI